MPEHFLDAHDFGAVLEQVRREAVAQHMRTRLALPADAAEQVVDVVPQDMVIPSSRKSGKGSLYSRRACAS